MHRIRVPMFHLKPRQKRQHLFLYKKMELTFRLLTLSRADIPCCAWEKGKSGGYSPYSGFLSVKKIGFFITLSVRFCKIPVQEYAVRESNAAVHRRYPLKILNTRFFRHFLQNSVQASIRRTECRTQMAKIAGIQRFCLLYGSHFCIFLQIGGAAKILKYEPFFATFLDAFIALLCPLCMSSESIFISLYI